MEQLAGKRFFVFGLARSGRAIARLLVNRGYEVTVYDDNPGSVELAIQNKGGDATVKRAGRNDPAQDLEECDTVVVSPGIPLDHELVTRARALGLEVTGELEIASYFYSGRLIGVTGTNGKSTVVTMIGNMLRTSGVRCAVAGNIGRPFADVVDNDDVEIVALEVSSFQLDVIDRFKVDVAVLLNVTPDHLDRYHESMDEYAYSKSRILNRTGTGDVFVYNHADEWCRRIAEGFGGERIPFSSSEPLEEGVIVEAGTIGARRRGGHELILPVAEFKPVGIHNLENAMAMVAVGLALDIDRGSIRRTLREYEPLPHRMEVVRTVGGVTYINDSKATNVDAAIKSLVSIDGGVILILGGLDKKGDFSRFHPYLSGVKTVILIGDAAEKIEAALRGHCETVFASGMGGAVESARRLGRPGDTVLLAPACASFDMFDNYEARGQAFRDAVAAL